MKSRLPINALAAALIIGPMVLLNIESAQAEGDSKPSVVIKEGETLPKCPAKISESSPRLCLRRGVLHRLYIPAGNPWAYGPCFAGGSACVELRYYGM